MKIVWISIVLLLSVPSIAFSQGTTDTDSILTFDEMNLSGELYSEAQDLYDAGDYEGAGDKFAESFGVLGDNKKAAYNAACSYALANLVDKSIEYARYAMELGMYDFEKDPDFANISETSEFLDLVWEAGIRKQAMEDQDIDPVVILPGDYDISGSYPLLVAFHGFGSSPNDFAGNYEQVARDNNCILMLCRGSHVIGEGSFSWTMDQEEFERIVDEIDMAMLRYSVNADEVILTGFSQGGLMCYSLGMALSYKFAGLIPVAGTLPTNISADKMKNKDIRIYAMCGLRDAETTVQANEDAEDVFEAANIDFKLNTYDEGRVYPENSAEMINEALKWILGE